MEEVGVGLEKDSIQVTLGEMIEAAIDQDQVQEQVLIEIVKILQVQGVWPLCQRLSKYIRYRKRTVRADKADA